MDSETSRKLYETYYMRVYSYAMTLAKDKCAAEELAQETFFRAMISRRQFAGDSDEFTWLCAIAKNLFTDEMRRQLRHGGPPPDAAADSGVSLYQSAADAEDSFRIHLILHRLEEPYREVFELRVFGELSFRQIGMIFSKTENWARVTYHRAKLKLQERMDNN